MLLIFILGTLFSVNAFSRDVIFSSQNPYNVPSSSYNSEEEVVTLKHSLAQRYQGYAGHCFAFSTASAIDYFLCNKVAHFKYRDLCSNNLPIVSTLQLTSLTLGSREKKTVEGGFANGILLTLMQSDPYLILENCAPYEKYLEYLERYAGVKKDGESWFQAAQRVYNDQVKLNFSCGEEFAKILSDYSNVKSISEIISFSRTQDNSFEKLLYETMIPKECSGTDKRVNVYNEIAFDSRQGQQFLNKEKINYDLFCETVKKQINEDTPVIINLFTGNSTGETNRVHSTLITGIKKVCDSKNECKTLFRIHNSYDTWWQTKHNDGWIEADPLIERSVYTNPALIWTTKR